MAQTKVPKPIQPPRCSTQKSVALERVRPEAKVIELSVLIHVPSARGRHGRSSAMSRNEESSARFPVSRVSIGTPVRFVALLVRFTAKVMQSTTKSHQDAHGAASGSGVSGPIAMDDVIGTSLRAPGFGRRGKVRAKTHSCGQPIHRVFDLDIERSNWGRKRPGERALRDQRARARGSAGVILQRVGVATK
jgi:hypothetical protein